MNRFTILLALSALFIATAAAAQPAIQTTPFPTPGRIARPPASLTLAYTYGDGYGYGMGYDGYDRATTPIQGIDYGIARIIRSEGIYNLLTSQAAVNLTEAQRRLIENWRLGTETYFEMRQLNREARAAERGPRPAPADLVRYAKMGVPRRLGPSELDTISGQLFWPILLRAPEFASFRAEVERAFATRAANGTLDTADYLKLYQDIQMMIVALHKQILDVPSLDYISARRFLESLSYEAQMPAI